MKIYILKYYDEWDDCYTLIGAFTEKSLKEKKEEIISSYLASLDEEDDMTYEEKLKEAIISKEKTRETIKQISYEVEKLNVKINNLKENNQINNQEYRNLIKERKRFSRQINKLIKDANERINSLKKEREALIKRITNRYVIEELEVIE